MKIKVVSWNIWVDGSLKEWKDFLDIADADVIGLQEVKDDDPERDIIELLKQQGYKHFFAYTEQVLDGKKIGYGPAVFSKFPIVQSEKIQLGMGDNERAAAYAQIDVNGTILHAFSTHLIHTHQQPSKEQENQINKLIARLPEDKVVVMGDFNATPESNVIKTIRDVLIDTDSQDLPTWSVYKEGCVECKLDQINTKLDYIFVSQDLEYEAFSVGNSVGSDHLPVSVVIDL